MDTGDLVISCIRISFLHENLYLYLGFSGSTIGFFCIVQILTILVFFQYVSVFYMVLYCIPIWFFTSSGGSIIFCTWGPNPKEGYTNVLFWPILFRKLNEIEKAGPRERGRIPRTPLTPPMAIWQIVIIILLIWKVKIKTNKGERFVPECTHISY